MNGTRILRCLKSPAVFLIALGLVAVNAPGQSTRARRIIDELQQQQPPQPKEDPLKPQQGTQKPPEKKPTPEPEAETIRIKSNLVGVPVSVTDAQGNPVRNLTAEDFLVEED